MDDAARLVSELHDKLAELDGKVAAYQRDMLAEFHRHMDDCLKKYPDHVSKQVSRAIAESISTGKFPALHPVSHASDMPAADRNAWDGRKSPPPHLPHTSGIPNDGPRSPHAREKEFQGLFTPTYLPLLESLDRHRSPPISPPPTTEGPSLPLSVDNVTKVVEASKEPVPAGHKGRPDPIRRLTDRSTSSLESSGSDSKVRRSALRRPSSIKGSPRRVRFEFQGEEVFPSSSSPQASPTLTPASGAEPQPEPDTSAVAVAVENESTEYTGTSLLDVEGEEDWLPKPKKVSSTQALQALTRSPLDEGTVWRVVNPGPEEPAKMNGDSEAPDQPQTEVESRAEEAAEDELLREKVLGSPIEELGNYDYDDGNDSEQEFLSMRPKRKTPSPAAKSPFAHPPAPVPAAAPANTQVNGKNAVDDDQEPFFDFDEEGQKSRQKYLPEPDDDDGDEISSRRLRSLAKAGEPTPPPERGEEGGGTRIPAVSPSAALFGHSVGSYMGRSINIGPINNPKLYDEIANMKNVHFSVGSIHDLTEAEAATMGSYRVGGSLARVPMDAPRSFTQRLALEEAMERRAAEEDDEE